MFKFKKINNVKINLITDVSHVISKIEKTIEADNTNGKILQDSTGIPFWQKYSSNISFARNFYINFPNECKIITDSLCEIKTEIFESLNDAKILNSDIKFTPQQVNLMRIPSGTIISPHIDVNRSLCINIGLLNSNSAITYVSDYTEKDFWSNPTESYQMEDGDVYLLNTKKYHSVKSIVSEDSNLHRYIITYTLVL